MTDTAATETHPCGPGCFVYDCPTSGQSECLHHGGFDRCCSDPTCPAAGKTRVIPLRHAPDANWWDDRTMPNDSGPDWHRDADGTLWQVDPRTGRRIRFEEKA